MKTNTCTININNPSLTTARAGCSGRSIPMNSAQCRAFLRVIPWEVKRRAGEKIPFRRCA